jgi:hypothetical protein
MIDTIDSNNKFLNSFEDKNSNENNQYMNRNNKNFVSYNENNFNGNNYNENNGMPNNYNEYNFNENNFNENNFNGNNYIESDNIGNNNDERNFNDNKYNNGNNYNAQNYDDENFYNNNNTYNEPINNNINSNTNYNQTQEDDKSDSNSEEIIRNQIIELCSNMAHYGIDPIELKKLDLPEDIIESYIKIKKNINNANNEIMNNEQITENIESIDNNSEEDSVMDMEIEDEEEKNSSIVVLNKSQNKINQNSHSAISNDSIDDNIVNNDKVRISNSFESKKDLDNSVKYSKDKIHSDVDNEEHITSSTETSNLNSPIINSYDSSINSSKDFMSEIENSIYTSYGYHKSNKYLNGYSRYHYVRKPEMKDSTSKPFLPNIGPIRCVIELSDSEEESSDEEDTSNTNKNNIKQMQLNKHNQLDPEKIKRLLAIEKKKQEMMKKIATMENLKAKKNNKNKSIEESNTELSETNENNRNQNTKTNKLLNKKSKLSESVTLDYNESIASSKTSSLNGLKSDDELSSGMSTPIKGIINNSNELNLQHLMDNNLDSGDLKILKRTLKKKEIEINILETDKKKLEIEFDKIQEKINDAEKISKDTKDKIENYKNQIQICEKLLEKNQQLYQEFSNKSSEMKNKINLKSQLISTISKDVKKYKDKIEKIKENQNADSLEDNDSINKENIYTSSKISESITKNDTKDEDNKISNLAKKRIQESLPSDEYLTKRKKINQLVSFDELILLDSLNNDNGEKIVKKPTSKQINQENISKIEFLYKSRNNIQKMSEILNILKKIKLLKDNKKFIVNNSENDKEKNILTNINVNQISNKEFKPYKSILSGFRSLHGDKNLLLNKKIDERKINPFKYLCKYETLGGQCKDTSCESQHLRDIEITDDEYLCKLLNLYIKNNDNKNDLKNELQQMRNNNESVKTMAEFIISKIHSKDNFYKINLINKNINNIKFINDSKVNSESNNEIKSYENPKINDCINLGLFNLLEKEIIKQDRYFNQELTSEKYENLLSKNCNDIELWIKYAVSVLPPEITKDNINKLNTKLDNSLHILSRALDQVHDSSALWNLYMDLYIKRESNDISIREIFEQLINIIPNEQWCWWLFLNWENVYEKKLIILNDMLKNFIKLNSKYKI